MTPGLKQFSATHTPLVRAELVQFFVAQRKKASALSPYLAESIKSLEEFTLRAGKGIRALLVILGYQLGGGASNEIYKVAAGIEVFHKHMLNLDDMADRDEVRNGGPTLWKMYEAEFERHGA